MQNDNRSVLISEVADALHGRRLAFVERADRGLPLHAYAQAHRRLYRQMDNAFDAVVAMEASREEEGWKECRTALPQRAADAVQDLYYRATELFDFYVGDLPLFLGVSSGSHLRKYVEVIKSARDHWAAVCNRCKHNHRFLVPVELTYEDGQRVTGFSVYGRSGDVLTVDPVLKGPDTRSYNWLFRRLIGAVVYAESIAADLIRRLPDTDADPISSGTYELPYVTVIERIINRPVLSMPLEARGSAIQMEDSIIKVDITRAMPTLKPSGTLRFWIDFLGPSITVRPPYLENEIRAGYTNSPLELSRPMGGFMRLEFADVPLKT